MKKKNLVVKGMAMLMACALVIGNTGIVAHAESDGCVRSDNEPGGNSGNYTPIDLGGGSSSGGSSSNSGGGSSSSTSSCDDGCVRSDNEPGGNSGNPTPIDLGGGSSSSGSSSNSGGGSSSSTPSYDDGCVRSDNEPGGDSGNHTPIDLGGSSSTASVASAPKAAGTEASAGKESFRASANAGAGTYKVTHKGSEVVTFRLMDADKKSVACTSVTLKQRKDKKYAIDFQVANAKGLTIGAPLDRTYMYNTLGVSYVTINDTVVIDIEAEAQAAAAK